jgi:hypothetical protein
MRGDVVDARTFDEDGSSVAQTGNMGFGVLNHDHPEMG